MYRTKQLSFVDVEELAGVDAIACDGDSFKYVLDAAPRHS